MGYKRSLESNEFDNLPFNKAKRVEGHKEVDSFDEIDSPNNAAVKAVISGKWCSSVIFAVKLSLVLH